MTESSNGTGTPHPAIADALARWPEADLGTICEIANRAHSLATRLQDEYGDTTKYQVGFEWLPNEDTPHAIVYDSNGDIKEIMR